MAEKLSVSRARGKRNWGSVWQAKATKKWSAAVPKLDGSGTKWTKDGFLTEEEAEDWRVETLGRRQRKEPVVANRTTKLGVYAEQVVKDRVAIEETTRGLYMEAVQGAIQKHRISGARLGELTATDIEHFLEWGRKGGTNNSRLYQAFAVIRMSLKEAVREKILTERVDKDVRNRPQASGSRASRSALERPEIAKILATAAGHSLEARFVLQLSFGFRSREVTGLTWEQIDFDRGTLYVDKQLRHEKRLPDYIVNYPKTRAGFRTVHLGEHLTHLLKQRRILQLTEMIQQGENWSQWRDPRSDKAYDLVFTRPDGKPLVEFYDVDQWHRLLRNATLSPRRRYDMRHTAATVLLADPNNSPAAVSRMLGHKHLSFTLDVYTDALSEDIQKLGGAVDKLYGVKPSSGSIAGGYADTKSARLAVKKARLRLRP